MSPRNRIALACAITGVLLVLPSLTRQLGTTSAQSPTPLGNVMVLRSGQILQGQITRLDNRYGIRLGEGNELRIAASDVDFIAASLDDACQRKMARVRPGNVDDHVQLAEWCLRQGLIRQAAQSTTEALRIAPNDRRVTGLERRLNALIQPSSAPDPASDASVERRSTSQLEQASRDLPAGTVQRFTTTLQPLLLNRCGTSGCHGSRATSDYRILRPALGQSASRRLTQQNLLATLSWIDRDNPDASSFLTHAKSLHGGQVKSTHAPLEQAQYEQLVDWVRLATQVVTKTRPQTIDAVDPKLLQTTQKITSHAEDPPIEAAPKNSSGDVRPEIVPSSSLPAVNLVDPFDPEVFNRRNSKKPG